MSHPSWVCGLKHYLVVFLANLILVTPFVGVWIETPVCPDGCSLRSVTPFVGVWIETMIDINPQVNQNLSHPSWVCGLKQTETESTIVSVSHTLRGCVD